MSFFYITIMYYSSGIKQTNYNSCGNFRNPADWTSVNMSESDLSVINRGFTGHLTLPEFVLINMEARLYDPFIARVLSPPARSNFARWDLCVG